MDQGIEDQRSRYGFSALEKAEVWDRWARGESVKAIGRVFGKPSSSIRGQLSPSGGDPTSARRRSKLALTLPEREEISRGLAAEQSARSLARLLGRAPSTVSREIRRNGGCDRYRAALSDEAAFIRAHRPKRCKLAGNARLRQTVARKLNRIGRPRDCRLAEADASRRREQTRVARDDLSKLIYSISWGI